MYGAAAFLALPTDDAERARLIDSYRRSPHAGWADNHLSAMSAYVHNRVEVRFFLGEDWRNCFLDASGVQALSTESLSHLDDLTDLIQLPPGGSSHERLLMLIDEAAAKGLITDEEKKRLLDDIASAEKIASDTAQKKEDRNLFEKSVHDISEQTVAQVIKEKGDNQHMPVEEDDDYTDDRQKPSGLRYQFIQLKSGKIIRRRVDHHNRWTDYMRRVDLQNSKMWEYNHDTPEQTRRILERLAYAEGVDAYHSSQYRVEDEPSEAEIIENNDKSDIRDHSYVEPVSPQPQPQRVSRHDIRNSWKLRNFGRRYP